MDITRLEQAAASIPACRRTARTRGPEPLTHRRTAPACGGAPLVALRVIACLVAFLVAFLVLVPGNSRAEDAERQPVNAVPVETMAELSQVLYACWKPPPGTAGSEITLRFGLTAKGEVRGKPLATYSVLTGDAETQRAFVAAAILALSRCTPIRMSEQLGRVVASRVLTLRFASGEART